MLILVIQNELVSPPSSYLTPQSSYSVAEYQRLKFYPVVGFIKYFHEYHTFGWLPNYDNILDLYINSDITLDFRSACNLISWCKLAAY